MRRPLAVRWGCRAGKMRFEASIQVVALAEATNQYNAGHDAAFCAEAVDLALYKIADFLDDGLEDFLGLGGSHDEKSRVETDFFVVRKAGEGDIDLLVLVLIEIPLDKLLKIPQPHLPGLALLGLHLIETGLAKPCLDMFLESIIEERATAEPTCPYGRLFHLEWL